MYEDYTPLECYRVRGHMYGIKPTGEIINIRNGESVSHEPYVGNGSSPMVLVSLATNDRQNEDVYRTFVLTKLLLHAFVVPKVSIAKGICIYDGEYTISYKDEDYTNVSIDNIDIIYNSKYVPESNPNDEHYKFQKQKTLPIIKELINKGLSDIQIYDSFYCDSNDLSEIYGAYRTIANVTRKARHDLNHPDYSKPGRPFTITPEMYRRKVFPSYKFISCHEIKPQKYVINRSGEIYSIDTAAPVKLTTRTTKRGPEPRVSLYTTDRVQKTYSVADLVIRTFGSRGPSEIEVVEYKDGDSSNVRFDNLYYSITDPAISEDIRELNLIPLFNRLCRSVARNYKEDDIAKDLHMKITDNPEVTHKLISDMRDKLVYLVMRELSHG